MNRTGITWDVFVYKILANFEFESFFFEFFTMSLFPAYSSVPGTSGEQQNPTTGLFSSVNLQNDPNPVPSVLNLNCSSYSSEAIQAIPQLKDSEIVISSDSESSIELIEEKIVIDVSDSDEGERSKRKHSKKKKKKEKRKKRHKEKKSGKFFFGFGFLNSYNL